jgi:hypothetical protein
MTEYRYTYRRGGVDYLLRAVFDGGRCKGSWTCPVCNVTKEPPREFANDSDAFGRLQAIVLTEHHLPVHVIMGSCCPG